MSEFEDEMMADPFYARMPEEGEMEQTEMVTEIQLARKDAEKAIAKYAAALHNAGYNALCIRQSVNGLGFNCAYIIPDSWDDQ